MRSLGVSRPILIGLAPLATEMIAMTDQPLYAALDVSLEKTTLCVMAHDGTVIREAVVPSDPAALAADLAQHRRRLMTIGLEAGPLSEWLVRGLAAHGLSAVLMETRQVRAALSAQVVKTDRKDARGMAHLLRTGWFRPVHVKTVDAREQRAMLAARATLVARLKDIENSVRGLLRGFGLRLPTLLRGRWDAGVRELVAGHPTLLEILEPLLAARGALREQLILLDKRVRDGAKADPVCRRLMTAPGVGAIVAMTFRAAVDQPDRFPSSKKVGACFGLTPRKYQSGETDRAGAISRAGDASVRVALFEAAHVIMTRVAKWSKLKAWAMNVAKRRGAKRAKVALARKLAVVLHRMWLDETDFRFGQQAQA
jgi:transposase